MVSLALHSVAAVQEVLRPADLTWLSEPERLRWAATTATRRRGQFVAGRWLARQCLARQLGGDWRDYVLSAGDHEAPRILAAPAGASSVDGLHLSLSHSGDWLACALACHPIGVDLECSDRPRDFQALSKVIHGAPALRAWAGLPEAEQQAAFYAHWTLKEAWLKQGPAGQAQPPMKAIDFRPCELAQADAMVACSPAFTLAVYPCSAADLRLAPTTAVSEPLAWRGWAVFRA